MSFEYHQQWRICWKGNCPKRLTVVGQLNTQCGLVKKCRKGENTKHIFTNHQYSLAVRFLRNKLERGLGAVKYHFRVGSMSVKWFKNNAYFTDIGTSMKWASFSHPQTDMLIGQNERGMRKGDQVVESQRHSRIQNSRIQDS